MLVTSYFWGRGQKKNAPRQRELAEGEKIAVPPLFAAPSRAAAFTSAALQWVGQHSAFITLARGGAYCGATPVQPAAPGCISPTALHAPFTTRGLSGQSASGYSVPFIAFTIVYCTGRRQECQGLFQSSFSTRMVAIPDCPGSPVIRSCGAGTSSIKPSWPYRLP